jgi:hypothetical protein
MVAPSRIERGSAQLANQPDYWGNTGLAALKHNNYRLFHALRNVADYVNYRWYRDVLGYDTASQEGLMQRLLGDSSLLRQLGVMMVILAILAGLSLLWVLYGGKTKRHPLDERYRRYCVRLARRGFTRMPDENPLQFAERIAQAQPQWASQAREIAKLYNALRYRPSNARDRVLEKRFQRLTK